VGYLGVQYIHAEGERRGWVDHSHEILTLLETIQRFSSADEATTLAFITTSDKRYLNLQQTNRVTQDVNLKHLIELVVDNPEQSAEARQLSDLILQRQAAMNQMIGIARANGQQAASAYFESPPVRELISTQRETFGQIQKQELVLLGQREQASADAERKAANFAAAGGFMSLVILLLALIDAKRQADLRVEAEREARKSEERFRLLIESVRDYAIIILDQQGHITSWSDGATQITGYHADEILGQHFSCFYQGEDIRADAPAHELRQAMQVGRYETESWRVRKDGTRFWANVITSAMRDDDGKLIGFSKVTRDLSERKRAEDEMMRARDAAEAATIAKSNFLAAMSHELRTPMTGVLGMIDLLRSSPTEQDHELFLETLKSSAKTLMTVLGDILDFSKIEAGRLELEKIDFSVDRLVREVVDLYAGQASVKGLVIQYPSQIDPARVVKGDPTRLRQILSNLVSNAIKFTSSGTGPVDGAAETPEAASISATGRPALKPGRWRFEVKDTGVGFDLDEVTRSYLFDAFTQADLSTTRQFGGTGLGLAICKRLVNAMGGEINAESQLGDGALFWFDLPLEPSTASLGAGPVSSESNPFQPSARSLNILVAEDNPVNQLIVTYMLQQMGHVATCVENGRLAVERVTDGGFDLILMDMQMPEMDGATATRNIRQLPAPYGTLPIIALTADATTRRREEYFDAGLTDFLTKPIDADALRAALDHFAALPPAETVS